MQSYQTKRLKQISNTAEKFETQNRVNSFKMAYIVKKSQKPNTVNIYLRITLNGKRDAFSTGISCDSKNWDSKSQQITNEPSKTKLLQNLLNEIQRVYTFYVETEKKVTFSILKGVAIGIMNVGDTVPTLAYYLDKEVENYEKLVNAQLRSTGVLKHAKQWVRHIKSFILKNYNPNLRVDEIKPIFAKELTMYIYTDLKLSDNSVRKIVGFLKKVLNDAVSAEHIDRNPIANHEKFKRTQSPIIFLTEDELIKIQSYEHFTPELQRVADCFLFCCATGLAYCDARNLKPENIKETQDGLGILKPRAKTNIMQIIWLNPEAQRLLEKYKNYLYCVNSGFCMPFISNQKMNQSLHAIEGILGIKKRLTTHVARKTAATFYANNGATEFTMKSLLGHSSIQVTQQYYTGVNIEKAIKNQKEVYMKATNTKTA